MSRDQYKYYKVKLQVVTPIHVGGGEDTKLNKMNYIHDKARKRLYVIDSKKFMNFLAEKKLFEKYIQYLNGFVGSNQNNFTDNHQWLVQVLGSRVDDFSFLSSRVFDQMQVDRRMNDLNLHVRTAGGMVYIPGSSIKGVIRNAITNEHVRKLPQNERNKKCQKILDKRTSEKDLKPISGEIDKMIYKNDDPQSKILPSMGIQIGDTEIQGDLRTVILKDQDYSINSGKDTEIPIFREYIRPGQTLQFSLKIDRMFSERLGVRSSEDIVNYLEAAFTHLYEEGYWGGIGELDVLIPPGRNRLILGANTGYHQKTIVHSLTTDEDTIHDMTRKILHKKDHHKILSHKNDRAYSPRVLNFVRYEGKRLMAGIGSLSFEEI